MSDYKIAAKTLLTLRDEVRKIPVADWRESGIHIGSIEAGYAVQDAMTDILVNDRGQTLTGYKIGATNQAARTLLGVDEPFFGRLYAEQTRTGATLRITEGLHVVAEPEIAIELGDDLDPAGAPFDAAAIRKATRALLPAIEIIASAFEPWTGVGGPTIVADNGAHGLWLPGKPVTDWSTFDVDEGAISVRVSGGEAVMGRGGAVDGNPFGAAAWLANALAARGESLTAGTMISTGTIVPPIPVAAGTQIHANYGRLGKIGVKFDT